MKMKIDFPHQRQCLFVLDFLWGIYEVVKKKMKKGKTSRMNESTSGKDENCVTACGYDK